MSKKDPFLPVNPELGKPENDEYRWVKVSELHDLMPNRLTEICSKVLTWTEDSRS